MIKLNNEIRELSVDELDTVSGAGAIVQFMDHARAVGYIVSEAAEYARAHGSSCLG